jgi:hypothetical protein
MPTIAWPATPAMRPESVEWSPAVLPEFISTSVFNQATQSAVLGAAYYVVKVTIGPRRRSEVPAWEAFIALFSDSRNRVQLWDWRWEAPRGLGTGAPLVNGVGQTGPSIATDGWPATTAGLLLPGDYVGLSGQLRRVVAQVDSNGAGQATLTLDQPVRASPADNSAVVLVKPTSLFICTTDKRARGFIQDGARHRGPTLEFMEVFS